MKSLEQQLLLLFFIAIALTGCFGPKSPQDVAQVFWKAVITKNVDDVIEYSTLLDAKSYNAFDKKWVGYQSVIGKIVIDGNQAQIETTLSQINNADNNHRTINTYLVKQNEQWKVDYVRTAESFNNDVLGSLMGGLNILGKQLSDVLEDSSNKFSKEMQRLENELNTFANTLNDRTNNLVEQYGRELQQRIEELSGSINRALKEHNNDLSDEDKRSLIRVSNNLDKSQKELSHPTVSNIRQSGQQMSQAQQHLNMIDNEKISAYKKQWHDLQYNFKRDLQSLLDELYGNNQI